MHTNLYNSPTKDKTSSTQSYSLACFDTHFLALKISVSPAIKNISISRTQQWRSDLDFLSDTDGRIGTGFSFVQNFLFMF